MGSLLIAGGAADANVTAVMDGAARAGVPSITVLTGANAHPALQWDLQSDHLVVDGHTIRPAAVFLRHDIFDQLASGDPNSGVRALAWYSAIIGWVNAHPSVRVLNRGGLMNAASKACNLVLAEACGLRVPATVVTNDVTWLSGLNAGKAVVKPLVDGGYCKPAAEVLDSCESVDGAAPQPAFVQERLIPPELRVYRIGSHWFGFHVESACLDYRTDRNVVLQRVDLEPYRSVIVGLTALTDRLGLDFGAADFKTCPRTGQPLFLEFNNAPMFAAFDRASDGLIVDAILETLCSEASGSMDLVGLQPAAQHPVETTITRAGRCGCRSE